MADTFVGSAVFFALAYLTICLLVLLLIRYYLPLRSTPAYLLVPVFLAIALPASIILLVPIDLAANAGTEDGGSRGIYLPDRMLLVLWRITYWLTFALTWFVLPLLGEYCDSGYRDPKDRFTYSLRSNARYQLIVLSCAIVGGVYVFIQTGFRFDSLKSLVMALAYTWGLILAIYLMGHGLVALPRRLYRYASVSNRLRTLQSNAPKVHERLEDAMEKLDGYEQQIMQLKQRKNGASRPIKEWIDELVETCSLPESRSSSVPSALRSSSPNVPAVITDRYMAELTRKLKRARHRKLRFEDEWDRLVRSAINTQAIIDSAASKRLTFPTSDAPIPYSPATRFLHQINPLTPYTRYLLHAHILPATYYSLATTLSLASVCIIWSEVTKSLDPKLSVVGYSVVHHPSSARGAIGLAGQLVASLWLVYMVTAALYSLTEVKIWGNRALVRRGTYEESATWYALQVAKLTVPLAYNFITFTPPTIYRNSMYYRFLGRLVNLTPLGRGFSAVFPAFILLPVLAALFNLYGKVKRAVGFGDVIDDPEADEDPVGTGSWREGRALIEREVMSRGADARASSDLGLASRPSAAAGGAAAPHAGRYRDEPSRGRPAQQHAPARRVERRGLLDEEPSEPLGADVPEGNWFEEFTERVRNTFETSDIQVPKWMRPSSRGGRGGGGAGEGSSGFLSLFGGGRSEGRVRLG